jgi:hypothetical protein
MKWKSGVLFLLSMCGFLCGPHHALAAQPGVRADGVQTQIVQWKSTNVQHVYGLPDAKAKRKARLL